jgi:hypothetical protein
MKLIDERRMRSFTSATSRSWRAIRDALMWIGAGVIALLALCLLGPVLVTYATAAALPIAVLAPLVSSIIAGWDVGGLLLIILGIRRLMTAYRSGSTR